MPSRRKRKRYRQNVEATVENPQNERGLMGPLVDARNGAADQALIRRAIRERWNIPTRYRKPIIQGQIDIAVDPEADPGPKTRAARTLIMANKQNMEAERLALQIAGIIGPQRDPFEGAPEAPVQATQIVINIPDNGRGMPEE